MITIQNLTKAYGSNNIFEDYNLSVSEGEMIAITGKSGKGKSTLLNIMGSLEPFESGYVKVSNNELKNMKHKKQLRFLREEVSFLFQNYALMENESVFKNITMDEKYSDETIAKTLEEVGLIGMKKRIVHTLSGGEQQRVALARIMLKPSKLVLADEPTGNLDETNAAKVWEILLRLKSTGKTVVVATHEKQALHHFDRVIAL